MSPKQKEALDFISGFIGRHGFSPSFQEITDALGIASKSGAKRLVDALADQGRVKTRPGRNRSRQAGSRRDLRSCACRR